MSEAWLGIVGAAVGAVLAFGFQQIESRRSEHRARNDRLRSERLTAFSGFAAALLEYRRAQIDRQQLRLRRASDDDIEAASADVSRRRVEAWIAFYRVRMTSDDEEVSDTGYRALTQLRDLKESSSFDEVDRRGEEIRYTIERLLEQGKQRLPD